MPSQEQNADRAEPHLQTTVETAIIRAASAMQTAEATLEALDIVRQYQLDLVGVYGVACYPITRLKIALHLARRSDDRFEASPHDLIQEMARIDAAKGHLVRIAPATWPLEPNLRNSRKDYGLLDSICASAKDRKRIEEQALADEARRRQQAVERQLRRVNREAVRVQREPSGSQQMSKKQGKNAKKKSARKHAEEEEKQKTRSYEQAAEEARQAAERKKAPQSVLKDVQDQYRRFLHEGGVLLALDYEGLDGKNPRVFSAVS